MTEDEAKTKWCPHAVASHTNPRQKLSGDDWLHACIGSACMAWRWERPDSLNTPQRVHPNVLATAWEGWTVTDARPDAQGYVEISPPQRMAEAGYCGLAGKP